MRNDNKLNKGEVELGVCDSQNLYSVVLCDPVLGNAKLALHRCLHRNPYLTFVTFLDDFPLSGWTMAL